VHAFAVHIGARRAPQPQRFRIATKLDADLFEYGLAFSSMISQASLLNSSTTGSLRWM